MQVGYTRKFCHFCGKECVHSIEVEGGFRFYICQTAAHALARQQFIGAQDDCSSQNHYFANVLRGE